MNSKLFLTFQDKDLQKEYILLRNKEVTYFSICLLVSRMIFSCVLATEYFMKSVTLSRMRTELFGMALHVIALCFGWKFPIQLQKVHALVVIISYGTNMVNSKQDFKVEDMISNIIGLQLIIFTSSVFINSCWIPTVCSNILISVLSLVYYRLVLQFRLVQLTFAIFLNLVLLSFTTYYCEKWKKIEFIQMRYNQRINEDMCGLIDNLPEGVIIYNTQKQDVVMANQESRRLFKAYNQNLWTNGANIGQQNFDQGCSFNIFCEPSIPEQASREKLEFMQKRILKNISFQNRHENTCNDPDSSNQSHCGDEYCVNLLSILEHVNEAECYEMILKNTDNPPPLPVQSEAINIQIDEGPLPNDQQIINLETERGQLIEPRTDNLEINRENSPSEQIDDKVVITFKKGRICFQNQESIMLVIKNITQLAKYESMKIENHFYELLTATVSHEMRTPLNAIISLLHSLDIHVNTALGKKLLQIIQSSSKILLFLVNDMLDIFQIKNGKFKKNERPVNLRESFSQIEDMFSLTTEQKGLYFSMTFDSSVPPLVIADDQRIKQILLNLLQNAVKFTMQGGINVGVSFDQLKSILRVQVNDTGIGMSEADQKKLFQLFGKLRSTSSINTSGIGLGLSICKKIVETFEGEIVVASRLGQGSTFTFTVKIPRDEQSEQVDAQQIIIEEVNAINYEGSLHQEEEMKHPVSIRDESPQVIISDQVFMEQQAISIIRQQQVDLSFLIPYDLTLSQATVPSIVKNFATRRPPSEAIKTLTLCNINNIINQALAISTKCPCKQRCSVLAVDDNIFNIIALQTVLEFELKLSSQKALNGLEAVTKVQERQQEVLDQPCTCGNPNGNLNYQVIFMDVNMPLMDGFQATARIKEYLGETSCTKIVALTAYTNESFKEKCLQAGMDGYLTKPISPDQIQTYLSENTNILKGNNFIEPQ